MTDTNVPIADASSVRFVLNNIHKESATSSNIPMLLFTKPIIPAFVTEIH